MLTPVQQATADIAVKILREKEALVRENRTLYQNSLRDGVNSPAFSRWCSRGERINRHLDRLSDAMLSLYDTLSHEDAQAVSAAVAQAVPDRWFEIPNALPPEER